MGNGSGAALKCNRVAGEGCELRAMAVGDGNNFQTLICNERKAVKHICTTIICEISEICGRTTNNHVYL